MFNDVIQFLDSIKDLVVNNLGVTIPSATTIATGVYAIVKTKLASRQKKTIAEKDTTISTLENKLEKSIQNGFESVSSRMDQLEARQSQDTAIIGESLNLLGQNSRAAGPETKAKLKDKISSLSGMTKEKLGKVKQETQEILSKIEVPKEVAVIKDKIQKAGQSLLDKYLSEDVIGDAK